jgi:hypothetical protein
MQNESGRKKMLTKVRSFTFSPKRVDALLSITPLALKSFNRKSATTTKSEAYVVNNRIF